jgi:hypothetical protein
MLDIGGMGALPMVERFVESCVSMWPTVKYPLPDGETERPCANTRPAHISEVREIPDAAAVADA